jgi:hypothetical protein
MNSFPTPPDEPAPARLLALHPPGESPVIDRAENPLDPTGSSGGRAS